LLDMMGDKTAARALAQNRVPTLPGTEEPITDRDERSRRRRRSASRSSSRRPSAAAVAACASCTRPGSRPPARRGAGRGGRAFGNPAVFLEKYIPRAKHIEVQILGDKHGNVIHLHERDCSVQRRHQKVIEVAPSYGLPEQGHPELCDAAARMAVRSATTTPARSSSSTISTGHEWFFIEMNPRIQVEHTVTEVITGIDLVRARFHRAGHALHSGAEVGMPAQDEDPRNGYAIQCRITTEDPENKFTPDYGKS
jgi:pyruvate carboxylase